MSRGQQGQVFNTAQGENQTYNQNAQTSFNTAQQDITGYGDALSKFAANNPYVQGGQAQTAANQELADTAAGQAQAAGQAVQSAAVRTGQNAGGAIAATEHMQEANERNLAGQEAKATQDRLAAGAGYGQAVLAGTGAQEQMQDALSTQQASAAQGALGSEEQAAQTPSFMDELGAGLIQGGVSIGEAYCPARGTHYRMADGSYRLVEDLAVGDRIMGIDGQPQTIEEIQCDVAPVLRVELDNGMVVRNSRTHTYALPMGGFTVALRSLGKTVKTRRGPARVVRIDFDHADTVYNVITDGSHTYEADGVWALGVGEAERHVSLAEWNRIGDSMVVRVNVETAVPHGR